MHSTSSSVIKGVLMYNSTATATFGPYVAPSFGLPQNEYDRSSWTTYYFSRNGQINEAKAASTCTGNSSVFDFSAFGDMTFPADVPDALLSTCSRRVAQGKTTCSVVSGLSVRSFTPKPLLNRSYFKRKHRLRAPLTISQKSLASRCLPSVLTYIRPHIL